MNPLLWQILVAAGADAHPAVETVAHATGEHAAHTAEHAGHPEIPNLITVLNTYVFKEGAVHDFLHHNENTIFFWLILILVAVGFPLATRKLARIPGRGQAAIELLFGGLYDFFADILGRQHARRFVPFVGTLFIFILSMNYAGMIPGFKSPTANIVTTASLAICTFAVVQYTGLRGLGLKKYLLHLAQDPQDAIGWCLSPLFFVLHLIGELAKPASLALRLFGNVTGEDILAGVLLGLFVGLGAVGFTLGEAPFKVGLPLHFVVFFLMLMFGAIQALIFSLLSAIYILLFLPHEEHEH